MGIKILNPGLLTTVQDAGRIGYQQFGVPVAGAMDPRSMKIANILLGNKEDEAVLECTMMGPQIEFTETNTICITGANLNPMVDGQPIATYKAVVINAGSVLKFAGIKSGCRAYIAFAGGLDIPVVMGSRSTYMKAKIGGFRGRKLEKDDEIGFRAADANLKGVQFRSISPEFVPRQVYDIRVIMGPQDDMFTEKGKNTFLTETYTVTQEFDRMGCRLDGTEIEHSSETGDIISDGIAMGAIQVPTAGKPIIMLADRQTTGGYTKIANVITADFRVISQLKMGDKIHFVSVTVAQAQDALLTERKALVCLKELMGRV